MDYEGDWSVQVEQCIIVVVRCRTRTTVSPYQGVLPSRYIGAGRLRILLRGVYLEIRWEGGNLRGTRRIKKMSKFLASKSHFCNFPLYYRPPLPTSTLKTPLFLVIIRLSLYTVRFISYRKYRKSRNLPNIDVSNYSIDLR